jgi:hypothetical protein
MEVIGANTTAQYTSVDASGLVERELVMDEVM